MLRAPLLISSLLLVLVQGEQRSATSCTDEDMKEVNEEAENAEEEAEVRMSLLQNSFAVAATNYDQTSDLAHLAPRSARWSGGSSTSPFALSPLSSVHEDEVAEAASGVLLQEAQKEGDFQDQDNGVTEEENAHARQRGLSRVHHNATGNRYPSRKYWHLASNGTSTHALRLDAHGTWALHKQVTEELSYVKCITQVIDKEGDYPSFYQSCKAPVVTEATPFLFGKRIQPLDLPRRKLETNVSTCNPSLVMLPKQMQRMHRGGRYLGVLRKNGLSRGLSFAILDSELDILEEGHVDVKHNVSARDGAMTDPRLFWYGNQLMLAFSNFVYSDWKEYSQQFVAPLHLVVDGDTLSMFISAVEARVIEICDGTLKGTGAKNLGFFTHNDVLHGVSWISPTYIGHFGIDANDVLANDGPSASVPLHRTCFRDLSMVSNATVSENTDLVHNGPGLVYISSRDAYLGIGHRALGSSPLYPTVYDTSNVVDIGDGMHIDSNLKWPHHYTMFFYTVEARPPFRLTHVGHEFCIGSKDCEFIQLATSLTVDHEMVLLGYGVNDAESFVANISLTTISEMLHVI